MTDMTRAIKSGHPATLLCAFLYFDVSFMIWILLGPLSIYIMDDFDLRPSMKGLLVATPILSGAFCRVLMGFLSDRFGPKRTGILGLGLTLIPLVWGWRFADSLGDLILMGILMGVAGASFNRRRRRNP